MNLKIQLSLLIALLGSKSFCQAVADCIDGFYLNPANGFCYKYHGYESTWFDAESSCIEEGGHLTSLENQEESDFVISLRTNPYYFIWVGLSDFNEEGK
mmetsp:Transcript_36406/g.46364  ORF Transcript_36406/g.46364 Transcript_36406/m.46364 type:complete len:99 (-) Transcript_36406:46-342(-)